MEIFVFLHMGGSLDRITIEIIAHPESRYTNSRQLLTAQFACFDAAKAQCFKVEDREKLLAVIEAAFGDFKEFNRNVRAVFATRVRPRGSTTRSSRRSSVSRWIVGQREGELEDHACGAPAAAKARRRFGGSPFRRKRQPAAAAAAAGGAAAPALGLTDRSLAPTPEHRRHVRRGEGCPAWCGVWTVVAWW